VHLNSTWRLPPVHLNPCDPQQNINPSFVHCSLQLLVSRNARGEVGDADVVMTRKAMINLHDFEIMLDSWIRWEKNPEIWALRFVTEFWIFCGGENGIASPLIKALSAHSAQVLKHCLITIKSWPPETARAPYSWHASCFVLASSPLDSRKKKPSTAKHIIPMLNRKIPFWTTYSCAFEDDCDIRTFCVLEFTQNVCKHSWHKLSYSSHFTA